MNYELAKQLKEAGFPQHKPNCVDKDQWEYYSPSLSELIEACGEEYRMMKYSVEHLGWFAGGYKEEGFGQTPTEAVANLWLELNKK